jgi:hypothetical protein
MNNKILGGIVVSLTIVAVLILLLRSNPKPASDSNAARQAAAGSTASALTAVPAKAVATNHPSAGEKLDSPREDFWNATPAEPAFAVFVDWTRRYAAAPDTAAKAALEQEGIAAARARLTAMADLIQADPKRALELAVPFEVRSGLPNSIASLLEEQINTRGDLRVAGVLPADMNDRKLPPVVRSAIVDGEELMAFTYGRGNNFMTHDDVPLNGVAVPASASTRPAENELIKPRRLLALNENPARFLGQAELKARAEARKQEPICSISQQPVTSNNDETVVELGGDLHSFCGRIHAEDWAAARIAASGVFDPSGGFSVPTAESSYTEGRKRMLCLRPYWSDYPITSGLTTNNAVTHFINFSNYMFQLSYGKLVFAPLNQGSSISVDILIPGSVNDYISGLGSSPTDLWKAVRDVASTNYGYNLSQYDFIYYCTGGKPSASYAGLGFVGGVGFHLANGYFGAETAGHEYGHNLGLNHAHFWDTSLQSIIGAGQNVEYGDSNDPMGGGGNPNQYNSRYKNYLGWITNTDIVTIPASGSARYRLYAFDLDNSTSGLRGLKFPYSGNQSYWVQFRQRKSNRALLNGAQLMWTDSGNGGSYVLDVRLKGSASDNAVVIGRTFSDTNRNFHFTPVAKGNTYPESLDVVVYTGAQPGNLPPVASLSASKIQANVGEPITFTAVASDPNNDTLAYYWEFSDSVDNYSIDNSPVQTKSFSSAGEYTARCVVSDMRGGTAQHTIVVRVGNPSTYRISGHVVDDHNRPLAGIRVAASASRFAFTDSDGSYSIVNLAAGSYSLSALEPVSGGATFVNPFFDNPITVGPDFDTADFVGVPGSLIVYTPLVAKSATGWKYHDKGQDLGTAWRATGYDDSTWSSGTAPLGYPSGSSITTVISYGADANNKYPTYYFRKQFTVANPAAYTNLLLEVLRDDGCAVYLNGAEIFRDNLVAGASYNTYATDNSSADGYKTASLPVSAIVAGVNTLAVEVHQVNATSSDIVMNTGLSGLSASNVANLKLVYLSGPADGQFFTTPTNVTLSASVFSGTPASQVDFYVDGANIGTAASAPYTATLNNPAEGSYVLRAVATINSQQVTSPPVTITVGTAPPVTQTLSLIPFGSSWRYLASNQAAPVTWLNRGFNDSTWPSGTAKLGATASGVVTTIDIGPSNARYPTIYFRRSFVVQDPASLNSLAVQLQRDDGAVVYLNGTEIVRNNIQNGAVIAYSTLATNASDGGTTTFTFDVSSALNLLTPGSNVVAVEVHQTSASSSDLAFELGLSATTTTNRSRGCWLVSPLAGSTNPLPGSITLDAEVVAGGVLGVTKVEFFADGQKIGEDTTAPFSFVWNSPVAGSIALTAVATDTAGATIASAPVNVTVLPPPLGAALISFGELWKYLDDGSNQGSNWAQRLYDDRLWKSGPARLGYGGDGEVTTLRYGTNGNNKFITTYFRHAFTNTASPPYDNLFLRLVRDDGAVVYLNGLEIYRNNMAPGPVSWNSLALSAIDNADETTPIDVVLPRTGLVSGMNVLAVEIHQANVTSSDIGFDLALIGLHDTNASSGVYLTAPAVGANYNVPANVDLSAFVAPPPGLQTTLLEYFADGTKVAQSATEPFTASWNSAAAGAHQLIAIATYTGGSHETSAPVNITVASTPQPITPVYQTLVSPNSSWRYWDSSTNVATGWEKSSYDDSAWPSANARFGWGLDGEASLLTSGRITHYFRRWFNLTNLGEWTDLFFYLQRDDGAVIYLNGVEIARQNMPAGVIGATTLASSTVDTPDETIWNEVNRKTAALGLLGTSNLIAVELHQASVSSSDAAFDLALYSLGTSERRIYISSPSTNGPVASVSSLVVEAGASAGAGLNVTKVEFYTNGVKLGECASAPWRVNWSYPPYGTHTIVARMFDSAGGTQDSAPAVINVTRELFAATLIPANSVWKYLDNGSNQGTNWAQPGFNDGTWLPGQARFGFGGDGEVTPLAGQPIITYYFRKTFVTTPGYVYTNLNFRLVRDDGAVVWLNGREAYRSNMPATGTIAYNTRPSGAVSGADEQTFFSTVLTITNLPAGTNVVAVEVHQIDTGSSDVGFNLELIASGYVENTTPPSASVVLADGMVELSWPSTYSGWQVYSAPSPATPLNQWTLVNAPAVLAGNRYVVTVSPTGAAQYFTLRHP